MKDKRVECGCHVGCTYDEHDCANPCAWPSCLTEAERQELAAEIAKE